MNITKEQYEKINELLHYTYQKSKVPDEYYKGFYNGMLKVLNELDVSTVMRTADGSAMISASVVE